jgi:hypothetical protein
MSENTLSSSTSAEQIVFAKQLQKLIRNTWSSSNRPNLEICRKSYRTKEKDAVSSASAIDRFLHAKWTGAHTCERAYLSLATYLFLAEGAYASYMNFIACMLVSQGHDLYDVFKRRFACSFEDIEDVNMETKEQFLKEHHLDLFEKGLNRKLRNAIAHYDFKIEKDGTIKVKGQPIDIHRELGKLYDFMGFLHATTAKAWEQMIKIDRARAKRKLGNAHSTR